MGFSARQLDITSQTIVAVESTTQISVSKKFRLEVAMRVKLLCQTADKIKSYLNAVVCGGYLLFAPLARTCK